VAIDLGTVNTLVWVAGRGIVLEEPLLAGVHDDAAILALAKVLFNRGAQDRVERFIQIIRELADNRFALH
jgi:actin-like ATPase involved in cell morphogenesis